MEKFLQLAEERRKNFFIQAGLEIGYTPIVVEKDFWVCWTLKQIFEAPDLAKYLTFKGGTSLSKAYDIIDRFSEDIDLTISKNAPLLADLKGPMEDDISGKERQRRIDALKENAQTYVAEYILPTLKDKVESALGSNNGWNLFLDSRDADNQTITFAYPKIFDGTNYILPEIKLEFGARGEVEPSEIRPIKSYIAQTYPNLFDGEEIKVTTLSVERTFWEKVTILHALHHGKNIRDRMSRHYYDTYMLMQKGVDARAIKQPKLLERVVKNKTLLFKDNKASYETAVVGSLKLLPSADKLAEFKKDYAQMQEMFTKSAPSFDEIISGLTELEKRINLA